MDRTGSPKISTVLGPGMLVTSCPREFSDDRFRARVRPSQPISDSVSG